MKALTIAATIITSLLATAASARDINVVYSEKDMRTQGYTPIRVDSAICDSDRNPTECDLFVLGARGKVLRFRVDSRKQSYTYVSASQREVTKTNVSSENIDLLLRLGVAIEKLGQDCISAVVLETSSNEVYSIQPGCDI